MEHLSYWLALKYIRDFTPHCTLNYLLLGLVSLLLIKHLVYTVSFTYLDQGSEITIFASILTTFITIVVLNYKSKLTLIKKIKVI